MRWALLVPAAILLASACRDVPYLELQVADDRLPFLQPGTDFDTLAVEARADKCANTAVEYAAQPLPATLSITPGDCFHEKLSLQASALLMRRRVAESAWLSLEFPGSGARVATATLAQLPGPQVHFFTGFEPGDPIAGSEDMLFVVKQHDVSDLVARVDPMVADRGARSIQLEGTATSTNAYVVVRAAATDLVIGARDQLVYGMRIEAGSASLTVGIDLQLDSGASAEELGLADVGGIPVYPTSEEGRSAGSWQGFVVDLAPAQGARLVGVLFGFDNHEHGRPGPFDAHLDDLSIEERK